VNATSLRSDRDVKVKDGGITPNPLLTKNAPLELSSRPERSAVEGPAVCPISRGLFSPCQGRRQKRINSFANSLVVTMLNQIALFDL
jgi:hypothetical protein